MKSSTINIPSSKQELIYVVVISELDLTRNKILSHWETEEQHILFQPALQSMLNPKVQQVQSNNAIADSENRKRQVTKNSKAPRMLPLQPTSGPFKATEKSLPTFRNREKLNPPQAQTQTLACNPRFLEHARIIEMAYEL